MLTRPGGFVVVVPVKSPDAGKSRLTSYADSDRARIAAAFATDTVGAAVHTHGVQAVVVVSDDAHFAETLTHLGAHWRPDEGTGLNGALRDGAAFARERWPEAQPVALLADLPALLPEDLGLALEQAAGTGDRWFVEDADGSGTTLFTADYDAFDPQFGAGSAQAHRRIGARPIEGSLATLRRDVDDEVSLAAAIRLGVGPTTALAMRP